MSQQTDGARGDRRAPGADRPREESQGQSAAEWITLAFSLAIVLAVVALVTYQYLSGSGESPMVSAEPRLDTAQRQGERYYLQVAVSNGGDLTAQDVRVEITLTPQGGGESETAEFTLPFLAGGATESAAVTFRADPTQGDLRITSISFIEP